MVAVDNTLLSLLLHDGARPPKDPATEKPLTHVRERLELLVESWELAGERILIPTPVLSEFLILAADDGDKYLSEISGTHLFMVEPFDERAAIELAAMNLAIMSRRDKREAKRGAGPATWAKITFDRQLVAIAKSRGVKTIYSDDGGVERFAERYGISVIQTWKLPLRSDAYLPFDQEDPTHT